MNQTINCQMAIIGGGLSGLFAAVRGAELGLENICVLEAGCALGGNGRMAVTFVSSDFSDYGDYTMAANAVGLFRRTMRDLHNTGNPALIRRYLFRTRELARWLEQRKLPMAPLLRLVERSLETAYDPNGGMDAAEKAELFLFVGTRMPYLLVKRWYDWQFGAEKMEFPPMPPQEN